MNYYGAKDLARSFRTVRKNTLTVANEIPEQDYHFRAAEGTSNVGEMLAHIALGGKFQEQIHFKEKRSSMDGFEWMPFREALLAEISKPRTKAEIIELLKTEGEKFAQALESVSDEFLGESVSMPTGADLPSKTRFEMLAGVKEHEMHHRAQLMLIQRMLGMKPHLTRENQARVAAMQARATATQRA